ncbi:MAG: aminoglycoside phosphotransferase family protein [Flavobacteriaceae bacterium]|nr:aminoglycoside phosphotransferase family protein [Flavobacteriaceae bacterium]
MKSERLTEVLNHFGIATGEIEFSPVKHGFINDGFFVDLNGNTSYILQRINTSIFKEPENLQSNIDRALNLLHDANYSKLEFVRSPENQTLYQDDSGWWRLMKFIPESEVHDIPPNREIAFEAGRLLGTFHKLLETETPDSYHPIIPNFHNIEFRFKEFQHAMDFADHLTLMDAQDQVNFVYSKIPQMKSLVSAGLPTRLCHNDTKLNNFLFSRDHKGLCLIDLDTIMPGYFFYDFGDAVRTVVNPASENETDLSRIEIRLDYFEAFINGFNDSGLILKQEEISSLPPATAYMPFLHGMRALTDYLNGNIYYKVDYAEHNLDRCKNLFQFTKIVMNNLSEIAELSNRLKK